MAMVVGNGVPPTGDKKEGISRRTFLRAGVTGGLMVAVGCDDDNVYLFDAADGTTRCRFAAGANLLAFAAGDLLGEGTQCLMASAEDGNVYALTVPRQ